MRRLKSLPPHVAKLDTRTAPLPAKEVDPFYASREWRTLVDKIKRERGDVCEDPHCKGPHSRGQRIYADHIVEIKDGGAKLNATGILLRCARSHSLKTARERAARMQRPAASIIMSPK